MDWKPYIQSDPQVMQGKLFCAGTRVPVSVVLDNLAAGASVELILDEYPSLLPEHIPAVLAFAAQLVRVFDKKRRAETSSGKRPPSG